jgi:putative ABC transport system substrate-binding protein
MKRQPMQRREFITFLGGAAAAWPMAARAQQSAMPTVGFLHSGSPEGFGNSVTAFRDGLGSTGYVVGRNVAIEYRWAHGQFELLPALAADLVRLHVNALVTAFNTQAVLAAKAATTTIPIVFSFGADPVQTGLVASLNRPGGNITGVTTMNVDLGAKRLGLLHELIPKAKRFALLINPTDNVVVVESMTADMRGAATAIGCEMDVFYAGSNRDIEAAFTNLQKWADALLVSPSTFFQSRRVQLISLAAHYRMPTMYWDNSLVEAGGLVGYASDITEQSRQAGVYAGRILKGEMPADLPVMRATKFEFAINLQTARLLGIEVPATLLAIADRVIE